MAELLDGACLHCRVASAQGKMSAAKRLVFVLTATYAGWSMRTSLAGFALSEIHLYQFVPYNTFSMAVEVPRLCLLQTLKISENFS